MLSLLQVCSNPNPQTYLIFNGTCFSYIFLKSSAGKYWFPYSDASGNLRNKGAGDNWSGEASRSGGLRVDEQRVDITIGDSATTKKVEVRKEQPVWMTQSTVINETTTVDSNDSTGGAFLNPDDVSLIFIHFRRIGTFNCKY